MALLLMRCHLCGRGAYEPCGGCGCVFFCGADCAATARALKRHDARACARLRRRLARAGAPVADGGAAGGIPAARQRFVVAALARLRAAPAPAAAPVAVPSVKIAVVAVTHAPREPWHASLYACFARQAAAARRVVVDSDGDRSAFFDGCGDGRVAYEHDRARRTVGWKRRRGLALARDADVVAFFDDDCVYGPTYLGEMVAALFQRGRPARKPKSRRLGSDLDTRSVFGSLFPRSPRRSRPRSVFDRAF
jgi:hypothetical protein